METSLYFFLQFIVRRGRGESSVSRWIFRRFADFQDASLMGRRLKKSLGIDGNALRSRTSGMGRGILRLRLCFAPRSTILAQDDNF